MPMNAATSRPAETAVPADSGPPPPRRGAPRQTPPRQRGAGSAVRPGGDGGGAGGDGPAGARAAPARARLGHGVAAGAGVGCAQDGLARSNAGWATYCAAAVPSVCVTFGTVDSRVLWPFVTRNR